MKYVFITGGVISGIGKGVIASSAGLLLQTLGLRITFIKIDPYMNIDAGTMSPLEHGECFVLSDGAEVDLDLGNYERYLNIVLTKDHNITTGKIYSHVIEKERRGDYLGKTVQVVPHITDAIQAWIERVSKISVDSSNLEPEVCIVELGGTVGDIESSPFIEALRQFQFKVNKDDLVFLHVSLVPVIHSEQKTKPTQFAIKDLRSLGISPHIIACRCNEKLNRSTIEKISMFCHVSLDNVIAVNDVPSTYHVPLLLEKENFLLILSKKLNLNNISNDKLIKGKELFVNWKKFTSMIDESFQVVNISIVGKYVELKDSYLSVIKALEHSSLRFKRKLNIIWIDASDLENDSHKNYNESWTLLKSSDGILIPGGFGYRGISGMIKAAEYARKSNIPYLGICLGMQVAVIEFCRNVLGYKNTNSMEFDSKISEDDACLVFMPEIDKESFGGTMRLGSKLTIFEKNIEWSIIKRFYKDCDEIYERHRHRYEVNKLFVNEMESNDFIFIGKDSKKQRMEIFELKNHRYFCGTQFHPEFTSKVLNPSKFFLSFFSRASGINDDNLNSEISF